MCCIDTGETLAPMIGLKVKDYYFSSEHMLALEEYIYDTFHSDGAGLSTTLRGMAEAMGSKIKYFDHNILSSKSRLLPASMKWTGPSSSMSTRTADCLSSSKALRW